MRIFGAIALAMFCAGCATKGPTAPIAPIDLSAADFSRSSGKATVKGQMFLRRRDGAVVYGAGSDTKLIPKTDYSAQIIAASFPGNERIRVHLIFGIESGAPVVFDERFAPYIRTTKADGQGNFIFQKIPPGSYFLLSRVTWCAPGGYGTCNRQGGDIYENVTVRRDDTEVAVMVTGGQGTE